jgi:hypothetical protein
MKNLEDGIQEQLNEEQFLRESYSSLRQFQSDF